MHANERREVTTTQFLQLFPSATFRANFSGELFVFSFFYPTTAKTFNEHTHNRVNILCFFLTMLLPRPFTQHNYVLEWMFPVLLFNNLLFFNLSTAKNFTTTYVMEWMFSGFWYFVVAFFTLLLQPRPYPACVVEWFFFFFFFLTLLLPRPSSNICGVNVLCSPNICDGVNVLLPFCCQDLHPKYVVEVMFFVHPTYMVDWVFHALCCCLLTLCCQFNAFFLHPTYIVELMFCVHPELMFCVHPVYIWWTDCFMLFAVVVVTRLLTVLCVFCCVFLLPFCCQDLHPTYVAEWSLSRDGQKLTGVGGQWVQWSSLAHHRTSADLVMLMQEQTEEANLVLGERRKRCVYACVWLRVCVSVRVCMYVWESVRVCVCERERGYVCVRECVCARECEGEGVCACERAWGGVHVWGHFCVCVCECFCVCEVFVCVCIYVCGGGWRCVWMSVCMIYSCCTSEKVVMNRDCLSVCS